MDEESQNVACGQAAHTGHLLLNRCLCCLTCMKLFVARALQLHDFFTQQIIPGTQLTNGQLSCRRTRCRSPRADLTF